MAKQRVHWASRLGFIMAAAGSAVGLGNIWKFPYITGENGGGLFVLIYLGCIVLVGLPIMIAEILIGRMAETSPVSAFKKLSGEGSTWRVVGWLGVASAFVILSYYSVVAGWSLNYILLSLVDFTKGKTTEEIQGVFGLLYASGSVSTLWHFVFMLITTSIVLAGIQQGIERACRILMPLLIALMVLVVVYALVEYPSGFGATVDFVLAPRADDLTSRGVLEALGHAFFTLSLGMGAMLTYGSYMSRDEDAVNASLWIVAMDTGIALLACFMLFPFVFATGGHAAAGPGLVFKTMPSIFATAPGGLVVSLVFFTLLALAALTSAISLLEVSSSFFIDEHGWERPKAVALAAGLTFLLGIPSAFAGGGAFLGDWTKIFGMNFFDTLDYLASNWMLTLGGLMIALYVGWALPIDRVREEFGRGTRFAWAFTGWIWTLRVVTPLLVFVVLLYKVGLLSLGS